MNRLIGFKAANPRTLEWERRDCVVRAGAIAMGLPYEEMHKRYKNAGRKDKRGTPIYIIPEALNCIEQFEYCSYNSPTLAQFAKLHKHGRWVLCNNRHAWAFINGVVHDQGPIGARTRIIGAWRVA